MSGSDRMPKGIITGRNETHRKQLNHLEEKIMSKRKLDSKYKDLVNYVRENLDLKFLIEIINDFASESSDMTIGILDDLNVDPDDIEFDEIIQIITDIYNNNYELDAPKHAYRLNDIDSVDGRAIYVTLVRGFFYFSTFYAPHNQPTQELTDEQFQKFLIRFPKFTADMFQRMEV